MKQTTFFEEAQSLQERFARRMTSALGESATVVSHDLAERLRVRRELALQRGRFARAQSNSLADTPLVTLVNGRNSLSLGAPSRWFFRLASGAPLLVLLIGMLFIQHWSSREQVLAAAAIDALLLADELPVRAYTDPGFAEFLKAPSQ